MKINTVLGKIDAQNVGVTLPHEHICCYYEPFYQICKEKYIDKGMLENVAVEYLTYMKNTYGLNTLIDCTPINIGRDVDLLKAISNRTQINIICSTGFYYTEEPLVNAITKEDIAQKIIYDVLHYSNAGVLKIAVENKFLSSYDKKIIDAVSLVQNELNLPICVHTNANNQNGKMVLERLLANGIRPSTITIGHLSDANDLSYVEEILKSGCYVGFDRIYNEDDEYMKNKAQGISCLSEKGYKNKILISHDEQIFNGFDKACEIKKYNVYERIFSRLLPHLEEDALEQFFCKNTVNMLCCE